jgi:plasmid maintenance system antidote protein VapI
MLLLQPQEEIAAMHTSITLLDALRAKFQLRSDYAAAKHLGVTNMTVNRWRAGGAMSDEMAIKFAHELGLAPAYLLACMGAQRSDPDTEQSGTWRQIADHFKDKVAVSALLAVLCLSGFAANDASAAGFSELRDNVYYVK